MDCVMRNDQTIVTVVDVGLYRGVFGTMWGIIKEEGTGAEVEEKFSITAKKRKKGQGMEGLWRGWRVGMWGLIGVWGAAALGGAHGAGQCGEF
jgi:fusion and transport protein UGO1